MFVSFVTDGRVQPRFLHDAILPSITQSVSFAGISWLFNANPLKCALIGAAAPISEYVLSRLINGVLGIYNGETDLYGIAACHMISYFIAEVAVYSMTGFIMPPEAVEALAVLSNLLLFSVAWTVIQISASYFASSEQQREAYVSRYNRALVRMGHPIIGLCLQGCNELRED